MIFKNRKGSTQLKNSKSLENLAWNLQLADLVPKKFNYSLEELDLDRILVRTRKSFGRALLIFLFSEAHV